MFGSEERYLKSFMCGCTTLENGCSVIAICNIFLAVMVFATTVVQPSLLNPSECEIFNEDNKILTCCLMGVLVILMLVYRGVRKRSLPLLTVWVIYQAICAGLLSGYFIMWTASFISRSNDVRHRVGVVVTFFITILWYYFELVVISLAGRVKKENERRRNAPITRSAGADLFNHPSYPPDESTTETIRPPSWPPAYDIAVIGTPSSYGYPSSPIATITTPPVYEQQNSVEGACPSTPPPSYNTVIHHSSISLSPLQVEEMRPSSLNVSFNETFVICDFPTPPPAYSTSYPK